MNKVDKIGIHQNSDRIIVVFTRFLRPEIHHDPTPSSLARLMRVMSDKPMLPETCEWNRLDNGLYETKCGKFSFHYIDYVYCTNCGKAIKVIE